MATVAEFTLDPEEFPLGALFDYFPEVTIQLERVVPDANDTVPYFWVRGTDAAEIEAKFPDRPAVRNVRLVDRWETDCLMRCQWVSEYDTVLDALDVPGVVLRSATGTVEGWTFEIRGETNDDVATFSQRCRDYGVPTSLTELGTLGPSENQYNLTEKQREALVMAYERGHFDSPREASLADVAADIDISQQALASRLRRGTRRLVDHCLIDQSLTEQTA